MQSIKNKGLKLLLLSLIYTVLVVFPFDRFVKLRPIFGIGFILIWLIFGLWARMGFAKGFFIGIIGSSIGIVFTIWAFVHYLITHSSYALLIMIPWLLPVMGLLELVPGSYSYMVSYLGFSSVVITIFLTSIGSGIGSLIDIRLKNKIGV